MNRGLARVAVPVLVSAVLVGYEAARVTYEQITLIGAGPTARVAAQSGAPTDAPYLTQTPVAGLSAEQALSALADGLLRHTGGTVARATPGTDYDLQVTDRLAADVSSTSTSFADTDLAFAVAASTAYVVECVLHHTSAATTTAPQVSLNGPASPTGLRFTVLTSTSATARHQAVQTAYDAVTNPGTGGGAVPLPIEICGLVENGSNAGTLTVRLRSEVAASTVTILARSFCRLAVAP